MKANDTIYRQDAIDSMMKLQAEDIEAYGASIPEGFDGDRAVTALKALPSAQPEPIRLRLDHELSKEEYERLKKDCAEQPIILLPKESAQPGEDIRAMCGECDAWNQYKNYPQPGWIPCSRELPKKDGQYIVTVKYEHVDGYEDIYSEHGEWVDGHWDAGFGHCGRVEKVLAWQPLPKPWEGEENG